MQLTFSQRCLAVLIYSVVFALSAAFALLPGSVLAVALFSNPQTWLHLHPVLLLLMIVLCVLCLAVFAGALLWMYGSCKAIVFAVGLTGPPPKSKLSRQEAADKIDRFAENRTTDLYEWDDFCISDAYEDPVAQAAVDEVSEIDRLYPPTTGKHFCSEDGIKRLREISDSLRAQQITPGE